MATKVVKGLMNRFGIGSKGKGQETEPEAEASSEYPDWKEYAECLTSDARWSTHVSTDKPIYRPGDTVHIRAVFLHPVTRAPVSNEIYGISGSIEVLSPKGSIETSLYIQQPENSVAYATWTVPEGQAGGEYTLKMDYADYGSLRCSPPTERKFQIRNFRSPKLNVRVEFLGRGYGPGDEVKAKVSVTRAEGGPPPAGTPVSLSARIDGNPVHSSQGALDDLGVCYATFKLPPEMQEGLGALTAVVTDGGNVESGSKTIPVVLQTVDVKFYPEGGVLVPGVENRVYFEARDPTEEPLEVEGEVWQVGGNAPLATLAAVHEGRGRFSFTPSAGMAYEVRVTKPSSVKKPLPLPEVEGETKHGLPRVVLRVDSSADVEMSEVANPEGAILVSVGSPAGATLRVALYKREVALNSKDVVIPETGGFQQLSLRPPGAEYSGVLRVTVFAERKGDWSPVAERLVFWAPEKKLHVAVSGGPAEGDGEDCVPGGRAKVEAVVTDALTGEAVKGAVVGLSVVDNSNLEQVDPRRRAPRLPAMALLEDEVDHLEDHAAYIDGSDLPGGSDPALAVDLLLCTQGWRRFLYQDPLEKLLEDGTGSEGQKKASRDKLRRAAGVKPAQQRRHFFMRMARGGAGGENRKERAPMLRAMAPPRAMPQAALFAQNMPKPGMPAPGGIPLPDEDDFDEENSDEDDSDGDELETAPLDGALVGGPPAAPMQQQELAVMVVVEEEAGFENERADMLDFPAADVGGEMEVEEEEPDKDVQFARKRMPVEMPSPAAPVASSYAPMPAVRVYAHTRKHAVGRSTQRSDFTETVYFAASLVTDANGKVSAEFDLSDSITSFAVIADAHKEVKLETEGETVTTTVTKKSKKGGETTVTTTTKGEPRVVCTSALGSSDGIVKVRSVKPFYVDAKCPLELTTSDRVLLPVTLVNAAPEKVSVAVQVGVQGPLSLEANSPRAKATGPQPMDVDTLGKPQPNFTLLKQGLEASSSARQIVPIIAGGAALDAAYKADSDEPKLLPRGSVTVNATASAAGGGAKGGVVHKDNVRREFAVSPKGFPQEQSVGGMLKPGGGRMGGEIALPKDTQPGSVVTSVTVFPSPVASLTQALEALIREPYGCFEQTSATVYPNIMAQQYFKTHSGVSPKLVEKSYKLLGTGLEKLKSFEVKKSGGYEWFGSEPAHEALTAYGLLEFVDMAQVYPVPPEMIQKTRSWLLSRKNEPERAFHVDPKSLDHFGGAPADISNAYIVWSLTYAKLKDGLDSQIASLVEQTATNKDPYFVALVGGTLYNVGRTLEAAPLAKGLEKYQKKDGCVYDAKTSITRSGGDSLLIETTAIAALCWLNEIQAFGANIRRAIDWLATRCKNGKFGSTQATVLALKAIIAYDIAMTSARAPGTVHLLMDGERIESISFDEKTEGAIAFGNIAARLHADGRARKVEVEMEGGAEMPYAIQVRYHSEQPDSAETCSVGLTVALQQPTAKEGDLVEVLVTVENKKQDEALPMTVAIVGLPGGLEPRHDQLKELVTRGDVAFYELRGREIIFYWRTLAAKEKVTLRVEAIAAVPGNYVGPASRAYLYYTDELKTWADPLKSSITPK